MLHYSLYKNHLKHADPDAYIARPNNLKMNGRADLIRDITGPGSILKPTETDAVIENYWHRIMQYLARGEGYSDEYISVQFSFRGDFKGEDDEFDPKRHEVNIISLLKSTVTEIAGGVRVKKIEANLIEPVIESVYDWGSETTNNRLTPGDVLDIRGENLKIHDNLEDEEGVYFISRSGKTRHRAMQLRTNEPKTLSVRIPEELTPGSWQLEVRNTHYGRNTLKKGIFTPVLKVD